MSARPLRTAATIWLDRQSATAEQAADLFTQQPDNLSEIDVRIYAEKVAHIDPSFAQRVVQELLTRRAGECVVLDASAVAGSSRRSVADELRRAAAAGGYARFRFLRHAEWVAEGLANVP